MKGAELCANRDHIIYLLPATHDGHRECDMNIFKFCSRRTGTMTEKCRTSIAIKQIAMDVLCRSKTAEHHFQYYNSLAPIWTLNQDFLQMATGEKGKFWVGNGFQEWLNPPPIPVVQVCIKASYLMPSFSLKKGVMNAKLGQKKFSTPSLCISLER